jgi:hypothetical protein
MTHLQASHQETLSHTDRLLSRIGVRPADKQVTILLFSNMFFSGLSAGMIRVCAFTLFLTYFKSEQLALIAIVLAVVGTLVTLLLNNLTSSLSVRGYIFSILTLISLGILAFRFSLTTPHMEKVIFFLPLWFELVRAGVGPR